MIAEILKAIISCFFASVSFAVLFNIRRDKIIYAGIVGMIGGILYKGCIYFECGEYISNFIAAVGLSIGAEILARKLKTPVTTFTVCALIPLVPGGYLFRMMSQAMQGLTLEALSTGLDMLAIAIVLAIGILIVSTFFRMYSSYKIMQKVNG